MKSRGANFGAGFGARPPGSLWRHASGGWYWTVRLPGQARKSFPVVLHGHRHATRNRTLALRRIAHLWREWTRDTRPAPASMDGLIAAFAAWNLNTAGARQSGYNERTVRRFVEAAGVAHADEIGPEAVQGYLASLRTAGRSERTIQAHRNTLAKFCRFLMLRQQIDHNPALLVEVRPPAKRPPRYLTEAQIAKLLKAPMPPWLLLAVRVGLYEGLRAGEIRGLRGEDVHQDHIVVGGSAPTKTRDYRIVPIFPEMRGFKPKSGPVFPQHNPRWWAEMFGRATKGLTFIGLGDKGGFQVLRSTFAVRRARGEGLDRPASLWELMS